jgi:hypothetical protein
MQNRQRCSRFSIVKSDYAELPRPIHWILNGFGAFFLAAPHFFALLSWFLLTWSIDILQSVVAINRYGAMFALLEMVRFGTSLFVLALALEFWSSRAEWAEVVYESVDDSCEDFSELFRR